MALDSQEKRMAVVGIGRPWLRSKFPIAAPDEQWRSSSGLTYGGNALSGVTVTSGDIYTLDRHLVLPENT